MSAKQDRPSDLRHTPHIVPGFLLVRSPSPPHRRLGILSIPLFLFAPLSYCSCCNAFGGYKYSPFVEVANTSLCKHSFVDSPIFHLHVFFSQNPDYFISSYKGDRQTKNTTNRRPPTQNETFQHHQYLDGQIFQQKYELFSNYFHYIATQNSCQWHFHRRVAWHVAGHKEVGFV